MLDRFMRLCATSGLVVAGLVLQQSSTRASFVVTASSGGSALAGASYANFDGLPATGGTSGGATVSFTGNGAAVTGSSANNYAAPILAGGNNTFFGQAYTGADATTYLSTGSASATLTFNRGPLSYLGLLWGSVDSGNTLTFFNGSTNVGSVTGAQLLANNGVASNTTVYVNILSNLAFTSVVATSPANSFEFDNVAYGAAVPEPSSLALCGIFGALGTVVARKRARRAVA